VVVHGIWQYQSFGTWRVLRRRKVPYAIFPHGALDPWFKRRYPFKHVKKWMYWPWAEYRVLRDAHAVLFASEGERVQSRESFRLYRANEVVVGGGTAPPPGAVQAQIDRFYGAFPELYAKRLVLYLGRLHPRKACDLAIRAFGAVLGAQPGWHLAIAGPDPIGWKHRLVALADKCGVATRTTWIDALAGDAKWGALRAADVLCLPSHGENFGIGAVEALACGTPVLISNRVGIWREVEACGGGLVAPDTHDGACSLLRSWFSMDENQRRRMQIGARACFEDNFEIGKAAGRLADALAAICTKESKNSAPPHAFSGAGVSPG
jgi:glycosyltransferase involved in cell wall biosynthesis